MQIDKESAWSVKTPLRIALIYAVIGALWILFSDSLMEFIFKDPETIRNVSIAKGWVYVLATAWLLYGLVKWDLDRRLELERRARDFYRRTIMAATEGKLIVTDRSEIEKLAGPPLKTWAISTGEDLSIIRNAVGQIAEEAGMIDDRLYDFILAVGEATTNVYQHATLGVASIHNTPGGLMCVVSDKGPGIEALAFPELALVRGYSTSQSMGMGYKAMISIADRVYLATGPEGTTVGIDMLLQPPPAAPTRFADTWRHA
jgi:anti-sigma regulatory factor (Ser/Thr protein kinase)